MTPFTPTVTKRVGEWDRLTKDYAAYVVFEDGTEELAGYGKTHHDAELVASDYILQFYNDHHTPERAAALIHQELAEEGRHEQLARDMGAVWEEDEPIFCCAACYTSDYPASVMQPAVCTACVQAWLRGYDNRLDVRYRATTEPIARVNWSKRSLQRQPAPCPGQDIVALVDCEAA